MTTHEVQQSTIDDEILYYLREIAPEDLDDSGLGCPYKVTKVGESYELEFRAGRFGGRSGLCEIRDIIGDGLAEYLGGTDAGITVCGRVDARAGVIEIELVEEEAEDDGRAA